MGAEAWSEIETKRNCVSMKDGRVDSRSDVKVYMT